MEKERLWVPHENIHFRCKNPFRLEAVGHRYLELSRWCVSQFNLFMFSCWMFLLILEYHILTKKSFPDHQVSDICWMWKMWNICWMWKLSKFHLNVHTIIIVYINDITNIWIWQHSCNLCSYVHYFVFHVFVSFLSFDSNSNKMIMKLLN